ncbi:hypothetical protein L916_07462 [Phytophthora nicotianae]|uniref:Uncharacterized protein n=1 Tax=Phytophthora nicotianae TaxID=4792 RepID=W2J5C4_PHYNI|nr:hypothetical protein L916_07462 [Phytophthora nicotianae]
MKNIVVTVPAYFNDSQADSLHHRVRPEQDGRRAQRADLRLGGGISDMSLLNTEEGIFLVKATAGDTHLDGEDSDNRLVEYFEQEFKPHHRKDLTQYQRALRRPNTFNSTNTHPRFENLCSDDFRTTKEPVGKDLPDDGVLNVEKPYHSSNPDKAVAFGAKKQASTLIFNTVDTLKALDVYSKPLEGCSNTVQSAVVDIFSHRRTKCPH